jgi:methylated-DNA-[protein]-cysteine S-methyltransferase
MSNQHLQRISTSWGDIVVQLRDGKVIGCALPHVDDAPPEPFTVSSRSKSAVAEFIRDIFRGCRSAVPLIGELQGSPFQKKVWRALMRIPAGETKSYAEIARIIGNPNACRAVANACGKNPAPLFIPCHRVIGSDGKLHGFSAGGAWKRMLLVVEDKQGI